MELEAKVRAKSSAFTEGKSVEQLYSQETKRVSKDRIRKCGKNRMITEFFTGKRNYALFRDEM